MNSSISWRMWSLQRSLRPLRRRRCRSTRSQMRSRRAPRRPTRILVVEQRRVACREICPRRRINLSKTIVNSLRSDLLNLKAAPNSVDSVSNNLPWFFLSFLQARPIWTKTRSTDEENRVNTITPYDVWQTESNSPTSTKSTFTAWRCLVW